MADLHVFKMNKYGPGFQQWEMQDKVFSGITLTCAPPGYGWEGWAHHRLSCHLLEQVSQQERREGMGEGRMGAWRGQNWAGRRHNEGGWGRKITQPCWHVPGPIPPSCGLPTPILVHCWKMPWPASPTRSISWKKWKLCLHSTDGRGRPMKKHMWLPCPVLSILALKTSGFGILHHLPGKSSCLPQVEL